ncbi:Nicotinamidase-related amidase [Plantibacter flavus]|uniref:Nicotinamidase-related amidase n=1 Tax=Plantibacter flavus TaxID=150123 RepID=A0A3N2C2D2_9MICO|nr:nicotinamidase-related amidase [Plantibacter flavus]SMG15345.1 Nicotinamidase-related amidase [Plantibacter flavus]
MDMASPAGSLHSGSMNDPVTARERTALLVIDVQQAFDDPQWGQRNNHDAESNVGMLLSDWRLAGRPVFHVRHQSASEGQLFSLGGPGYEVKPEAREIAGEPIVVKTVNSAFIGTDLEVQLRRAGISSLVICGLTTDHCVSTTTRMAANLGFHVTIVSDATATFERLGPDGRRWSATELHDAALASLHEEFAVIQTTNEVVRAAGS